MESITSTYFCFRLMLNGSDVHMVDDVEGAILAGFIVLMLLFGSDLRSSRRNEPYPFAYDF